MISTLSRHLALAGAAVAVAIALAAAPPAALAGEVADRAAAAEAHAAAGNSADAIATFDAAHEALWSTLPLSFRIAVFADGVTAFGKYEPASGPVHPGDTLTIYLEPVGYGFQTAGALNRVSLTPSIEIRTPGGLILGETSGAGKLTWEGRAKSREVHAALSVALPDLKPGDYELLVKLVDDATGKEATVTLPFTVTAA